MQENLDHLKRSGFEVERTTTGYAFTLGPTTTGYAFTLGPKSEVVDLYVGKEECEVIQKVGKILEIRLLDGPRFVLLFYMPLSEQANELSELLKT